MIRYFLPRFRRARPAEPQMILPREGYDWDDGNGLDPDVDLSYADALLVSEIRHSLHGEYDALEPPADSFTTLMRTIDSAEREAAKATLPAPIVHPAPSLLARLNGVIAYTLSGAIIGLSRARMVSGGVALLVILSVLGANVSFLLGGNDDTVGSMATQVVGEASERSGAIAVPPVRPAIGAIFYDAKILRSDDPPDTQAPPIRHAAQPSQEREIAPRQPKPQ